MEDHLKDMRKVADRVLFNDHDHEKEIINKINQRVRVSPIKSKRKWPEIVRYLVHGSILAIFVFAFAFIIMNKLDISGNEKSSLKKKTASVDDVIQYDPATFKGIIYTDLLSDYGLERARQLGITQDFQKTVTSNNVQFKIEDVYYDGVSLTVAYGVKNQGSVQLDELDKDYKNPRDKFSFMVDNTKPNGGYSTSYSDLKKISSDEFKGIYKISLRHPVDKFTLNFSATKIMGINGEWNIDIPISIEKIKNSIAIFYPNYKTTSQDGEITVNKVMFTPSAIQIEVKNVGKGKFREFSNEKGEIQKVFGENTTLYSLLNPPEADGGLIGTTVELSNGKFFVKDIVNFSPKSSIPKELTLNAYHPDDINKDGSRDNSKDHKFTIPLEGTNKLNTSNSLGIEIDGKTKLIPAETLNNIGIVKEIKIPVAGVVRNTDDKIVDDPASRKKNTAEKPFVYETVSTKMVIEQNQMDGTVQHYLDNYKPSEQNKTVPVVKVDMEKYPLLKEYDGMLKVEGENLTEYYLIKSFEKDGQKKIREIKIQSPTRIGETFLLKMISSLATATFN